MPIISRKERSHPWRNLSPGQQARVVLMRFGLGPKPGIAPRLASEDGAAFRACLREIEGPEAADALLLPDEEVKTACSDPAGDVVLDYANCCRFGAVFRRPFTPQPGTVFNAEYAARYAKALEPEVGYGERLVHFWSNHFSIISSKATATLGYFERSVIRKHALGKFVDMLKAVYQHPAMICNLDNQVSVGPNSRFAKTHKHLAPNINENLAREIFELHTLAGAGRTVHRRSRHQWMGHPRRPDHHSFREVGRSRCRHAGLQGQYRRRMEQDRDCLRHRNGADSQGQRQRRHGPW